MATSDYWQRASASASLSNSREWVGQSSADAARGLRGKARFWMFIDAATVVASAAIATLYRVRLGPLEVARALWHGTLIHGRSLGILLAFLCGFTVTLILTSRRLNLYSPIRIKSIIKEQSCSLQACLTSGLLLTGALYLVHAEDVSRAIVLGMLGLVTVALGFRRLLCSLLLYRRFARGLETRNVLIVGTGPQAVALRYYLESVRHLGYSFKGFIEVPGSREVSDSDSRFVANPDDVVGTLDALFTHARSKFVDEIFFTTRCERGVIRDVLEQARAYGVDLRLVPDMYDGLTWNRTIEYIGQFPTVPLHYGHLSEVGLLLKRAGDLVFSAAVLILLLPLFVVIAIAVKLDSPGPVFYASERVGKKGRVFRCIKFRTMVSDAEQRRAALMDRNERDGVLFKITDDPRITRLGRWLRKYSLDEFPQFFNVLLGDMSVVGPRPLPVKDVQKSKLAYLRVLAVTPGVTGLWQVEGRQDPSSDSYISLNVVYIDNWSIWLDFKIILRTVGAVLAGTGV